MNDLPYGRVKHAIEGSMQASPVGAARHLHIKQRPDNNSRVTLLQITSIATASPGRNLKARATRRPFWGKPPWLGCKAVPCSAVSLLTLETMPIASTGLCSQSFFCSSRPRASCSVNCHARSDEAFSNRSVDFATRRALLSLAASVLATPALAAVPTSPYEDAKSMSYGLDEERSASLCMPL